MWAIFAAVNRFAALFGQAAPDLRVGRFVVHEVLGEGMEVTRGGVDTRDISSKTFEANETPGLYFIGEVLDVTGWLGGYNFQWAWASGHCCGQAV